MLVCWLKFSSSTKLYLSDVHEPTARQSFYLPNVVAQDQQTSSAPEVLSLPTPMAFTPMPTELERRTIFTGPWSASYDYLPQSSISPSLSPSPPSTSTSLPPNKNDPPDIFGEAWILHPCLFGIEMQMDIKGGSFDTSKKKGGVFVKPMESDETVQVISSERSVQHNTVPYQSVVSYHDRPKPATENKLMVVARNSRHIGEYVRRIHHFYQKERTEENHFMLVTTIDRSGFTEKIGDARFEIHPNNVEFVKETSEERRFSKTLLRDLRAEFSRNPVETRPGMIDPVRYTCVEGAYDIGLLTL